MQRDSIGVEAILFDFDGVLFDTSQAIKEAWRTAARKLGRSITDEQLREHVHGVAGDESLRRLFGDVDIKKRAEIHQLIDRYEETADCPPIFGAVGFLEAVSRSNLTCALVTGSWDQKIDHLFTLHGIRDQFAFRVTRDCVKHGKPAADPYVLAINTIRKTSPSILHIVAIEDSVAGVQSAHAAGCICVGIDAADPQLGAALLDAGALITVQDLGRIELSSAGEGRYNLVPI